MPGPRRIERGCGLAAGILGLVALGVALFAPLATVTTSCMITVSSSGAVTTDCSTAGTKHISIVQNQGFPSLLPVVLLFSTILIGIALFAVMHSRSGARVFLVLLWVFTALLLVASFIAILSIGVVFLPSVLLALVAAIAGSRARERRAAPVG
jgi:hypothetical protein